jgi:AraC family transcriptional regulator
MDGSYALPCGAVCAREATPGHIGSPATDGTQVGLSSLAPARKMIELLQSADAAVASDQARARQLIDRVVNILRTTLDERENAPAAPKRTGRLAPWQEQRLTAHIESNLSISMTTADLAAVVNLSPSYFSRAFKRSFGKPPHSYLTTMRAMRAQELMLATDEPLSQIAAACGLVDQSHLCRLFRRTVGRNPGDWRRTFKGAIVGDPAKPISLRSPP